MRNLLGLLALLAGLTAVSCPRIEGFVIDDAVAGAKVEITELDEDGSFLRSLRPTTTDETGFFRRRVPARRAYERVYAIRATGGRFTDVATGLEVDLAARDGLLESIVVGPGRYAVTPISSMAAELALQEISAGATADVAIAAAAQEIGALFASGGLAFDPNGTIPAPLNSEIFSGARTPEKLYGAVLAGLSQCAADRDERAAEPGTITTVELTEALVRDIRDGAIDGVDGSVVPPQTVLLGPTEVPLLDPGLAFEDVLSDCIARVRPMLPPP